MFPDVLMLTIDDNANTGWRFFKCVQHLGLKALFFKGSVHPFLYPEQGIIHPSIAALPKNLITRARDLAPVAEYSKAIHYFHSTFIDTGVKRDNKRIIMQHGGANYRVNHEGVNKVFNNIVDYTIVQMPDLAGLGAKNEHLIYFPVDTEFIKPKIRLHDEIRIGHFPSNPHIKGSSSISTIVNEFMDKYKFGYGYSDGYRQKLPWLLALERMQRFDVIIETFSMKAQGLKYGEWGNTALEAAAMGKLVITNSLGIDMYKESYGVDNCPLLIANTEDQLREKIEYVLTASRSTLEKHMTDTRLWVEKYHSIPATAQRLWDKIYREIFS